MEIDEISRLLGEHGGKIDLLSKGQAELFEQNRKLIVIAEQNKGGISIIASKLDNGVKGRLDEICSMAQERIKFNDKEHEKINEKVDLLIQTSWVGKVFDTVWKKMFAAAIFIMLLSATTVSMWGIVKSTIYKEKSGMMQSLSKDWHVHKDPMGNVMIIHSHNNPDGERIER